MTRLLAIVLTFVLTASTAQAQPSSEPVAILGAALVGGGLGIMIHPNPCCCKYQIGGAVAVVGAGAFIVYLGMRPRRVTPSIGLNHIGATIRWGR